MDKVQKSVTSENKPSSKSFSTYSPDSMLKNLCILLYINFFCGCHKLILPKELFTPSTATL
jgi:hypothetical protein